MRRIVFATMLFATVVGVASCVGDTPSTATDTGTDAGTTDGGGSSSGNGSSGGTDGGPAKCVLGQSRVGDGCKLGP